MCYGQQSTVKALKELKNMMCVEFNYPIQKPKFLTQTHLPLTEKNLSLTVQILTLTDCC